MRASTVLLVDSDQDTRTILRDVLEHAGHTVLAAATGEEGLVLADAHRPDVIIGDFPLEVPGHSPFTADIRSNPRLSGTRLLAVTARAMDHEIAAARAVADEVLVKPVEPAVVLEVVARMVDAR